MESFQYENRLESLGLDVQEIAKCSNVEREAKEVSIPMPQTSGLSP